MIAPRDVYPELAALREKPGVESHEYYAAFMLVADAQPTTLVCPWCDEVFTPMRSDQLYCRVRCRAAYNHRVAARRAVGA